MAEFRGIVRLANKDLKGELKLPKALSKIKGIGVNLADSLAGIASSELKVPRDEKVGNLSDEQLDQLEGILVDPVKYGVPLWLLNRRGDPGTGKSGHLIAADLEFQQRQDITNEKNIRSYRGVRHMFGLPVRGQRTKTMGRSGMTLGVIKKKEMPKTTGKKEEEGGKREKK